MSEPVWSAPLAHRDLPAPGSLAIDIASRSFAGMIDLRLPPDDSEGREAAGKALGIELPAEPRTSRSANGAAALWFSIDQWLIVAPRDRVGDMLAAVGAALDGRHHALADVSDMRCVLRLSGEALRPVLAKCVSVDVFADEFVPGFARRVTFGEIAGALHVVADDPWVVDLYVFRSYADYALTWIAESARSGAALSLFAGQTPPAV